MAQSSDLWPRPTSPDLSGQPTLPVTINPGDSFQLNVIFAPILVGFTQGTLRIDTISVPLTGSGTPPPGLPAYTFQGPNGNIAPQSQLGIGLKRAAPYPVALAGTLTPALHDLTASGFRDTTRVAAGDPALWSAIFAHNRQALLDALARFSDRLLEFRRALEAGDGAAIDDLLTQAKKVRDALGS